MYIVSDLNPETSATGSIASPQVRPGNPSGDVTVPLIKSGLPVLSVGIRAYDAHNPVGNFRSSTHEVSVPAKDCR